MSEDEGWDSSEEEQYLGRVPESINVVANPSTVLTEYVLRRYGYDPSITETIKKGGVVRLLGTNREHIPTSRRLNLLTAIEENDLEPLEYDY